MVPEGTDAYQVRQFWRKASMKRSSSTRMTTSQQHNDKHEPGPVITKRAHPPHLRIVPGRNQNAPSIPKSLIHRCSFVRNAAST